ncbi:MAG: ABC transporter ATP-binding protein [Bacteroidia bacterium]
MKSLGVLNKYFLKYKWHFLLGVIFVTLSTLFRSIQGVIIRDGTNDVLTVIETQSGENAKFLWLAIKIIGFALVSGLFMFLMRQTIIVMSRHIEYDQKNEIYKQYQKLDVQFYKSTTTGDLMNRISEDVSKVRMYTGPAIMYLANTTVTIITVLIFMINVHAKLTLFVLLPLPFLAFIIYKISDTINRKSRINQEQLSKLTSLVQETLSGIRLIKAYGKEDHFENTLSSEADDYKGKSLSLVRTEALFAPTMLMLVAVSTLITIWYGGKMVIEKEINFGNITEFIFYIFQLTWPFASLGWVMSLVQRAAASQTRINEFLQSEPIIKNSNQEIYEIKGDIEFSNVSFTYPENNVTALKNISFKLNAGESLGITGAVGSGKSTILKLLTRQYDVSSGVIYVDGKPIQEHNLEVLRNHFGMVPQEVVLFNESIQNNISFGFKKDSKHSDEEIIEAAKNALIHDTIIGFKDKYDTIIGERGVTLSGGQKQRLSIARALVGKPNLVLLDDCLSAVDAETESTILLNLKKELNSKTSIVISHRLSGIKNATKILYLKDGEIIEFGNHTELINAKGAYYKLYSLQNN